MYFRQINGRINQTLTTKDQIETLLWEGWIIHLYAKLQMKKSSILHLQSYCSQRRRRRRWSSTLNKCLSQFFKFTIYETIITAFCRNLNEEQKNDYENVYHSFTSQLIVDFVPSCKRNLGTEGQYQQVINYFFRLLSSLYWISPADIPTQNTK